MPTTDTASARKQRLRKTKAELVEELEALESLRAEMAAVDAACQRDERALRENEERAKAILNPASQRQGLLVPDVTLIEDNTASRSCSDIGVDGN